MLNNPVQTGFGTGTIFVTFINASDNYFIEPSVLVAYIFVDLVLSVTPDCNYYYWNDVICEQPLYLVDCIVSCQQAHLSFFLQSSVQSQLVMNSDPVLRFTSFCGILMVEFYY